MLLYYKETPESPAKNRNGAAIPGDVLFLLPAVLCSLAVRLDDQGLELALTGVLLAGAWIARHKLPWTGRPPEWCGAWRLWSRIPWLACTIPAVVSIALRVALLPWIPVPHPAVPDEYSHLFLAKTLLAGRLANPTHPLWPFFESIHIISQPTFSSMYMPGQGLFLAAGKILTGHLFGGVVLSTALFCAALTWFLRGCVPPGWAFYGGLLAAVHMGAASYWNDSYWGGSAGALGGALVFGAYVRLVKCWSAAAAFWFAMGVLLLANTRPYEGAGLTAVLGLSLLWKFFRYRHSGRWIAIAVAMVVLALGGIAMTRYFKAVTGSAFTLPYQVNQRTYGWPMTLAWSTAKHVEYRHHEFELYRDWEAQEHEYLNRPSKIATGLLLKYAYWWRFFFGIGLTAVFLFTTRILRARRLRMVWIAAGVVVLTVIGEQSGYPHYIAPAAPAILLFAVMGLRYMAQSRSIFALALVRGIIPVWLIILGVRAAAPAPKDSSPNYPSWCCVERGVHDREPLVEKIAARPGKHLVIVTYDLASYDTFEWVYNDPDIDTSKIIWARDMGAEKDRELLAYYADRRVWRVLVTAGGWSVKETD